jgi:hypothetical protein
MYYINISIFFCNFKQILNLNYLNKFLLNMSKLRYNTYIIELAENKEIEKGLDKEVA